MTQEDKELLLKDLCARLPYGIKFKADNEEYIREIHYIKDENVYIREYRNLPYWMDTIKPYLRPMSSMTNEEGKELEDLFNKIDAPCWVDTEYGCVNFASGNDFIDTEIAEVYTDWLNAHHFDYRGLIPRGLALEAPEDMYNIKNV